MCKLVRPRVYLSQKSNGSSPPASFFPPLRFPEVTKSRMKLHKLSITVHCVWLHISVAIYSPWLHGPQSTDKGLGAVAAYPSGKAQCTADSTSVQTAYLQNILTTGKRQQFVPAAGLFATVVVSVRCHQDLGQQTFTAAWAWTEYI